MSAVDKKRIKAENVMRDLEELAPQLTEAYEAYLSLSVAYYDLWDRLQYYRKHGVVSDDEVSSYPRRPGMDQTERPFGQRLKEHRRKKKLIRKDTENGGLTYTITAATITMDEPIRFEDLGQEEHQ